MTDREGASIQGNFGIPAKAAIEFEISWKTKPDFVFALGIDDKDIGTVKRAFRFEAWGSDLVIQRELENEADLAVVQEISPGPGRAHLQAYLDQEAGRILVCSQGGKQLASLKVGGPQVEGPLGPLPGEPARRPSAGMAEDRHMERRAAARGQCRISRAIHRADGSIVYGQVVRFDASSREFVHQGRFGRKSDRRCDKITGVFLSLPGDDKPRADPRGLPGWNAVERRARKGRERRRSCSTVPGISQLAEAAGGRLAVAGRDASIRDDDAAGQERLDRPARARRPAAAGPAGGRPRRKPARAVWCGSRLRQRHGQCLEAGCLRAHHLQRAPSAGAAAAAAAHNQQQHGYHAAAGRAAAPAGSRRHGLAVCPGAGRAAGRTRHRPPKSVARSTSATATSSPRSSPRSTRTESGSRPASRTAPSCAHAKVKAVELARRVPNAPTGSCSPGQKANAAHLPRMQKADPPTHLIRSKNGDYLRGRVSKMDDKTLEVEVRLENKEVPRDRISRIIWLHADELDESKKPARAGLARAVRTRVQVVRNDGVRLTFQADQFAGTTLSGKSDVLGACQVAVSQIDQLLIGSAIDQAAAQLAYQQWKLKNAPEPKYVTAGDGADGAGGDTGTESPLVGKPAPDFTLDLVGGKPFHLADSKGKEVVVLDFWATWCGPCLQAMPQVERAAAQFKDQNVRLVAVNLQETAEQVTALLERQKLHVTVALDRDGVVADKYKAVAIPQTVIIGRDGNVARLFVGGGARLEQTAQGRHEGDSRRRQAQGARQVGERCKSVVQDQHCLLKWHSDVIAFSVPSRRLRYPLRLR